MREQQNPAGIFSDGIDRERAANLPDFTQVLVGVPNKFSEGLSEEQRLKYRQNSDHRWEKVRQALSAKCGEAPEAITEEWVLELLDDFAQQPGTLPSREKYPPDHKRLFAAMLWEYLQGAAIGDIKEVAKQNNWIYGVTEMTKVQQDVARYAGMTRKEDAQINIKETLAFTYLGAAATRNSGMPDREYLYAQNRQAEDVALQLYTPEKKRDDGGVNARIRRATALQEQFGGNTGAYLQMLNVLPGVIVEEEERQEVRAKLLSAIVEMVRPSIHSTLPSDLQLNMTTEARWLVLLCGKRLVRRNDQWFLADVRPDTLRDIRDTAYREHMTNKNSQTADDVERSVLLALDKVVEYRNKELYDQ